MKELEKSELMEINGGSPATCNYIGGLSPAIPESGGDFVVGFFKGLIKSLFS
jgi:bacteriocin-like protein